MTDSETSERARLQAVTQCIAEALEKNVSAPAYQWLVAQSSQLSRDRLSSAYTAAGRKLGGARSAAPTPTQRDALECLTYRGFGAASIRDLGRAYLFLCYATSASLADIEAAVSTLYYKGDANEQTVVVRCLCLLPSPVRYQLVATDAARSHVQPVFEALACENPYPGLYLDDGAFNQIVIKAFFVGVKVQRIHALSQRNNPELRRMALDFASERRAAGRPVPPDLDDVVNDQ